MLTFLLDEYRTKILKEYRLRLWSLYLGLFSLALLTGCVLALPQYVALESKRDGALIAKTAAENAPKSESDTIKAEVKSTKEKISVIKSSSGEEPILFVLERLLERKGAGIALQSIALTRGGSAGAITISGVADTRDALVSFSKSLQGEPSFANASLPVSALAKNKDIPFSISIDSKF